MDILALFYFVFIQFFVQISCVFGFCISFPARPYFSLVMSDNIVHTLYNAHDIYKRVHSTNLVHPKLMYLDKRYTNLAQATMYRGSFVQGLY